MTTLREAATQALGALEGGADSWQLVGPAIDALKEALVEDAMQNFTDVSQEIEAALAEPVQEPVAWMVYTEGGTSAYVTDNPNDLIGAYRALPLYTAPPQRKPLTEEEIEALFEAELLALPPYPSATEELPVRLARAVERAHGIDGAPEERNFCPRCGKRTSGIHTCTPPAPLTDEVIADLWHQNGGFHHHFARAIERWLRGHA